MAFFTVQTEASLANSKMGKQRFIALKYHTERAAIAVAVHLCVTVDTGFTVDLARIACPSIVI